MTQNNNSWQQPTSVNPSDPYQSVSGAEPPGFQGQNAQYQSPPPYQAPYYPPARPTNTLAIISLVTAFVFPFVVPVVLGHMALSQIKRTNESGYGLAVAGLVIGYIYIAVIALFVLFGLIAFVSAT